MRKQFTRNQMEFVEKAYNEYVYVMVEKTVGKINPIAIKEKYKNSCSEVGLSKSDFSLLFSAYDQGRQDNITVID